MIRKFSFGFLIFTMVMWSLGTGFVPQAQALTAGDLVKGPNSDAVYYIGADNKKYVFPDAKTYFTWYSDFSAVQTVSVSELDMHNDGGTVTYRPGTKLVTTVDTNKVYAVEPGGVLRWISSESDAIALWGSNWAQRVQDVIPGFFSATYTLGSDLGSTFPTGSLIQMSGDATIYYVDGTEIRPFADGDAFEANGLDFGDVVTVSSLSGYTTGSSITGEESDISSINASSSVTTAPGALTVSLAADTPASTIVPASAARVPFTKVNFTNTSNNPVTVDQVVVMRGGVGQDGAFSGIDLLNASTMRPLNNNDKSFNSLHKATFNDDFVVPANSTMGVYIAANMASSLGSYAGEFPVLMLDSVTLKGSSTLSGSLPIAGNPHTLNGTISIGTVTVSAGAQNPAAATKEVGTKNYVVSSIKVEAGSAEKVRLTQLTFTNNGSTSASDLANVELWNANTNTLVGTPSVDGDKFTFNFDMLLDKGDDVTFDLELDIESGSARTISLDVDEQADLTAKGETYGFNILPTWPSSSTPYYDANNTTVGNGTLRFESMSVTPTNISEGLNDVVLGKFKAVAKGEPVQVSSIGWTFDLSTSSNSTLISDITNVTIFDANGNAVAGPKDPTYPSGASGDCSDCTATTTDSFTVPVGETVYTVKADLSDDFTANDTIQVGLFPGAVTAEGEVTGNTIVPTPSTSEIESSTLTVKAATLAVSVSSSPSTQTVVAGTQDFLVANYILDASQSGTAIEVTAIKPTYKTTGNAFPDMLSGWTLWVDGNQITIDSDTTSCSGLSCSTAASNATTTLNIANDALIINPGQSKTVAVKADIGTGATSGTLTVGLNTNSNVTAVDSDANTVTPSVTNGDGQAMTLSAGGTLNTAIGTDPSASVYVAGTSGNTIGEFTVEAKQEGMQFNSFGFTIADASVGINGNQDELTTLELYDGATLIGSVAVSGANATITPNSTFSIDKDVNKTLTVKATFPNLNDASPASSGGTFNVTLSNIDVDGTSAGSSSVTVNPALTTAFNNVTIYEGVPTIARVNFSGSDTVTGNSTIDIFKHSVSVDSSGGRVGLFKFSYIVTTSTLDLSNTGYYLYESSSSGSLGNIIAKTTDFTVVDTDAGGIVLETYFDVNDDSPAGVGEHRILEAGVTRYYTLRGTVTGHDGTADNESISVSLAGDAAHAVAGTTQEEASVVDGDSEDDFIWSDLNFSLYSTPTATATDGWFNGYLLPGLDDISTTAQVVTD